MVKGGVWEIRELNLQVSTNTYAAQEAHEVETLEAV